MKPQSLASLLEKHPLLEGMEPEHLEFLAGCSSNHRIEPGDSLVREGEEAGHTYLIRTGRMALELHLPGQGTRRLQTVEPGEMMGWSWLFPPYRWHFDAVALEPTMVLALDGACLRKKLDADHSLGYAFLLRLVFSMHQKLERTRLQLLDVYGKEPPGP
jgi:CRP/FNR family transcriptional regulator, cyclic AMP receptor protein